jgi:hypothetical protein
MNKRIELLAKQADLVLDDLPDNILIPLENFAELIVQECATVIERNLFQGIGWNTSRAVKKHFGIEIEE